MAKKDFKAKVEEVKAKVEEVKEMSLEEARKWRASLAKAAAPAILKEEQVREAWRLYWAQEKSKWANSKDLEHIIWLHLKAVAMAVPSRFEEGIKHFGLKKIS
jgi:hypothetical protein